MFAGAYLGQAVGGSGVLFLTGIVSFKATFFFVGAWILSITLAVALPLREPKSEPAARTPGPPLAAAGREMARFVGESLRAFTGSRGAFCGVLFAILPAGACSLSLALQSNLSVELGMTNSQIGWLSLWSTIVAAGACVVGGVLSDRFGRRRMLTLYTIAMSVPTLWLAAALQREGWVAPLDPAAAGRPGAPHGLIAVFWVATLAYALFNGLMYGTRTALFMDITTPAVAATQFTAYMALLNVVIWYSARWQGLAIERWGYPATLVLDAIGGLLCLAVLPFVTPGVARGHASPPAIAS
jgi:PAT family beta-lactamase induction signal transducer AmpG